MNWLFQLLHIKAKFGPSDERTNKPGNIRKKKLKGTLLQPVLLWKSNKCYIF